MFDWAKKLFSSVRGVQLWSRFRKGAGGHAGKAVAIAPVPAKWARYHGARPEPRGAPANTVLALRGYELFSPEDFDALFEVVEALGIPADSLWTVIHHESQGRAAALNPEPAAGLIQLTTYAKLPGYDTAEKVRALIYQTAREQLRGVVSQYYGRSASIVRGMTPGEMLLFNFTPKFVGRPESTVISSRGQAIYDKNHRAFDREGKGTITVGDVYRAAERITAEAGGRRVTREGKIVMPSGPESAAPGSAPAPRRLPAGSPAPKSTAARSATPKSVAAPKSTAAPRSAAAPQSVAALKSTAAPKNAASAIASVFKGAPRSAAAAAPSFLSNARVLPGADDAPAEADESSAPATLVSGPRGNPNTPARMNLTLGDKREPLGIPGARTLETVRTAAPDEEPGGALEALSRLTTGGPADADSDPRGLLLSAVQADLLDPIEWTWVPLPDDDLEVLVPNDAFKATLGDTAHVRIPVSYAELRQVCKLLGCVPATKEIVDAIYRAASVHPKPVGLVQKTEDTARMNTVGFVLKYHAQLEKQLQEAAGAAGLAALSKETLIEPAGKWWIFDPKLGKSKYGAHAAVNYGWFKTSVRDPIQSPGGAHDDTHCDYSQLGRAVHRYARRASTHEQVDLCELYAQRWPELSAFIDVFR